MARKRSKPDPFEDLSWNDVHTWAGSTIVSRGKSYQSGGRVKELARTSAGCLVAWVQGTGRYATVVEMDETELRSSCSCPYW